MGLTILVLGLVVFLGAHVFVTLRGPRAAVIGRLDASGFTAPHACVVLPDGAAPGPSLERELCDWLRGDLAHYKVPRGLSFVAELPKTASGKIQRFRLRTG